MESPQKQRYPIRPGLVKQERPDETDYAHGPNGMAQYRTTLVPNQQNRPSQMGPGGYARGPDPNQQNKPTQLGPGYALGPNQTLQRTTLKPGFEDPNKLPDESSEIDPDTGLRKTTPRPKQSLNIGHPDDTDYAHGPNGMLQRTTARPLQQSKPTHLGPGGYVLGPSETLQRTTVKPGFEDPIKLPDGSSEVDPDTGLRKTTLRTFRVLGPRTTQRPRVASKPVNYLPRECSSSVPHVEHPFSCYKFLHCSPTVNNTWEYVEKTCGPSMMFNPDSMICDWDYNVIKIKQKCGVTPEVPYAQTKRPTCKDGFKFNDCASPCGYNACHFYGRYLINSGKCDQDSDECIPGCLPANALQDCVGPKVWRDSDTCVNIADCTCMTPAGVQMRPGQVIKEPCKTCQCINNDYICEETACGPTSAPPVGFAPPQPAPKQPLASCNPLVPMIEHYNNCSKYMVCTQLGNGSSFYQEQICQKTLLFNPVKLACDLPLNVIMLKPQCDNSTSSENKEPQGQLGESGVVYVIPSTVTPPLECDPEK